MAQLVHYCPGSSYGSPAWMTRAEAEIQLGRDTHHINKLVEVESIEKPVIYPHINGRCPKCKERVVKG